MQGDPPRASRVAIFLSGFVCPGLGQLSQRRWLAGVAFMAAFGACFAAFMVFAFRVLIAYYRLGLDFNAAASPDLSFRAAFIPFLLALVVYLASLHDTYRAYLRLRRAARPSPLSSLDP